jgi:hypothetical protein
MEEAYLGPSTKDDSMSTSSPQLQTFRQSISPKDHSDTTLCFIKSMSADSMDISFDFGVSWDTVRVDEITHAEMVKRVDMSHAQYDLARLFLKESHPTIEIAALSAQVRHLRGKTGCDCASAAAGQRVHQTEEESASSWQCGDLCAGETGCAYTRCLFWCAFLR